MFFVFSLQLIVESPTMVLSSMSQLVGKEEYTGRMVGGEGPVPGDELSPPGRQIEARLAGPHQVPLLWTLPRRRPTWQ